MPDQLPASLSRFFSKEEVSAQQVTTNVLKRVLDKRFVLIWDTLLPELGAPIPLILVGPTGIWVIYPYSSKGIFRATNDVWEVLNSRTQRYIEARPNLMTLAVEGAEALGGYLSNAGIEAPQIEPILYFSDPGIHVDSSRPAVRILLSDALERFAGGVIQNRVVLEEDAVQSVVGVLVKEEQPDSMQVPAEELRDAFSFQEPAEPKKLPTLPPALTSVNIGEPEFAKDISRRVPFSRRQWVLLALLLVVNLLVLVALVLIVWLTA